MCDVFIFIDADSGEFISPLLEVNNVNNMLTNSSYISSFDSDIGNILRDIRLEYILNDK